MFFPKSRYYGQATYQVTLPNGAQVTATRLPMPQEPKVLGFHRRHEGQRLDLIANYYLKDPEAFHRLCDAGACVAPDALAAHERIAIPAKER